MSSKLDKVINFHSCSLRTLLSRVELLERALEISKAPNKQHCKHVLPCPSSSDQYEMKESEELKVISIWEALPGVHPSGLNPYAAEFFAGPQLLYSRAPVSEPCEAHQARCPKPLQLQRMCARDPCDIELECDWDSLRFELELEDVQSSRHVSSHLVNQHLSEEQLEHPGARWNLLPSVGTWIAVTLALHTFEVPGTDGDSISHAIKDNHNDKGVQNRWQSLPSVATSMVQRGDREMKNMTMSEFLAAATSTKARLPHIHVQGAPLMRICDITVEDCLKAEALRGKEMCVAAAAERSGHVENLGPWPQLDKNTILAVRRNKQYQQYMRHGTFNLDGLKAHCLRKPRFLRKALQFVQVRAIVAGYDSCTDAELFGLMLAKKGLEEAIEDDRCDSFPP